MAASVVGYAGVSDFFSSDLTKTTTGHSWSSGDVIVVIGIAENGIGISLDPLENLPTNANLTFSVVLDKAGTGVGSGDGALKVWTATAGSAQTSQTISVTRATNSFHWGFTTYVVTGTSGVGDYDGLVSTTTTPTVSLTVGSGDVVLFGACDWNAAIDSATVGPSTNDSGATGYEDVTPDGNSETYGGWFGHFTGTTSGTNTYGLSPITGLALTTGGVVLTASGGSVSATMAAALGPLTATFTVDDPWVLTGTTPSSNQVDLTWNSRGFTAFDIERDGSVIVYDHGTNSYSDTGRSGSTLYGYKVRGVR